jgi:hypothetical protein
MLFLDVSCALVEYFFDGSEEHVTSILRIEDKYESMFLPEVGKIFQHYGGSVFSQNI